MNNLRITIVFLIGSAIACLLALAGIGCTPTTSTDPLNKQIAGAPADQAPLAAKRITVVSDLPVPANMRIRKGLSHSYEGAGTRMVDYTYQGVVDIRRVHRFYREQMPLSNWQLFKDNFERGVFTMTFQKGSEVCTVIISKGILETKVRLLIQTPKPIN